MSRRNLLDVLDFFRHKSHLVSGIDEARGRGNPSGVADKLETEFGTCAAGGRQRRVCELLMCTPSQSENFPGNWLRCVLKRWLTQRSVPNPPRGLLPPLMGIEGLRLDFEEGFFFGYCCDE